VGISNCRWGVILIVVNRLREKKVRQLNRQRAKEKRLSYRSKYNLAREMLLELDALLPAGSQVYVLFDSWYASAKLINLCLRKH